MRISSNSEIYASEFNLHLHLHNNYVRFNVSTNFFLKIIVQKINIKTNSSEFLDILEDMYPKCHLQSDVQSIYKCKLHNMLPFHKGNMALLLSQPYYSIQHLNKKSQKLIFAH